MINKDFKIIDILDNQKKSSRKNMGICRAMLST